MITFSYLEGWDERDRRELPGAGTVGLLILPTAAT